MDLHGSPDSSDSEPLIPHVSVLPNKKALDKMVAKDAEGCWNLVAVWETFLQAQARASKLNDFARELLGKELTRDQQRQIEAFVLDLIQSKDAKRPEINISALPPDFLANLRKFPERMELSYFDRRRIR